MPANLSPEFKAAQAAYRRSRDPQERLDHLREMLRAVPKHKGTEHLQADIKSRIRGLTDELSAPRKAGARRGPVTTIRPEGAAQVALLGPPNSGKSTFHHRLTRSHTATGPYPFTTTLPQPGMLPYNDIHFQLVDLPPISAEHPVGWIGNALQPADASLLVVDLAQPGCVESVEDLARHLAERRVYLTPQWPAQGQTVDEEDALAVHLPTALIFAKCDLLTDVGGEVDAFLELSGLSFPWFITSVEADRGLDEIGPFLFEALEVVRVYTKTPGRAPEKDSRPYALRRGGTVADVAGQVHKDIARSLKYARLWGADGFAGQQVGRDHVLNDGDVIELHA